MPYPPMDKTTILLPLPADFCPKIRKNLKDNLKMIKMQVEYLKQNDTILQFQDFLSYLDLTKNEYISSIRSGLHRPTVFLERSIQDIFFNAYNPILGKAWRANTDIQFILDPYACCKYVAAYVSKSCRGMSEMLKNILKEVEGGNVSLKQKLQLIGNTFMNGSEV